MLHLEKRARRSSLAGCPIASEYLWRGCCRDLLNIFWRSGMSGSRPRSRRGGRSEWICNYACTGRGLVLGLMLFLEEVNGLRWRCLRTGCPWARSKSWRLIRDWEMWYRSFIQFMVLLAAIELEILEVCRMWRPGLGSPMLWLGESLHLSCHLWWNYSNQHQGW